MLFNFKKRKERKEIEDDYYFIQKEYIKAIARDFDYKELFKPNSYFNACFIKFSKDMNIKEIKYQPEKVHKIKSYYNDSYDNSNRHTSRKRAKDDELYVSHLYGDVGASRLLGMDNPRYDDY